MIHNATFDQDFARVLALISGLTGYPCDVLLSRNRRQVIVIWRQLAQYLLRQRGHKLIVIAAATHCHYSTVIKNIQRVSNLADVYPDLRDTRDKLSTALQADEHN